MSQDPFRHLVNSPLLQIIARQQELNRSLFRGTTGIATSLQRVHAVTPSPILEAARQAARTVSTASSVVAAAQRVAELTRVHNAPFRNALLQLDIAQNRQVSDLLAGLVVTPSLAESFAEILRNLPVEEEDEDDSQVLPEGAVGSPRLPAPAFTRKQVRMIVVYYVQAVTFLVLYQVVLENWDIAEMASMAAGVGIWQAARMCAAQAGNAFDQLYPPDPDEDETDD
ncbi:hypothetical protein [Streptosporangium sp. NPDC048865]|uniref:hypothetical protein n=1 Tax=Streptosporangium sp. NPDC048865 TaxID=3155766 RepID=UPI00341A2033